MKAKGKKFISLFLIISLMSISCTTMTTQRQRRFASSKERKHGAELIITKKNGYQTEGELITVKPNSLLLLSITGRDISVDIADIKVIRVVKKSKAATGALIGVLVGGGGGALVGGTLPVEGAHRHALTFGLIGALGGALIGGIIIDLFRRDKTIQIEGMSDLEIQETLEYLRKRARIRDYK